MKYKFLDLLDEGTSMPMMILEFEEVDAGFLKKTGWGAGLRVVLNFSKKRVTCISGQSFFDRHNETIDKLSQKMDTSGTVVSFKEALNYVNDIRQIPDEFNVCDYRNSRNWVKNRQFIDEEIYEILDDYGMDYCKLNLRKYHYCSLTYEHVAVFDTRSKEILYDVGRSSAYRLDILAKYMWLPFSEANVTEVNCFKTIQENDDA